MSANTPPPSDTDFNVILNKSIKRATGGGLAGASAMIIQVCTLMWMRTTMNYQYRHGSTTSQALRHLYAEGGVRRLYRGIGPALFQGPLSRFGDTAANTGTLTMLNAHPRTKDMPIGIKTFFASLMAASWRITLMPIDTCKTILQVEGKDGLKLLFQKFKSAKHPGVFWHGSLAAVSATFVGHYPWFATFNYLDQVLPQPTDPDSIVQKFGRRAGMGFTASIVSDTCSNSIRVIKTTRQTFTEPITYPNAVRYVLQKDGIFGLLGRGLKTRILANGMQGLMFSVLWKTFEDMIFANTDAFK